MARHQSVLDAVACALRLFLRNQTRRLEDLASEPSIQDDRREIVHAALADGLANAHFFSRLSVFQTSGTLIGCVERPIGREKTDWLGRTPADLQTIIGTAAARLAQDALAMPLVEAWCRYLTYQNRPGIGFAVPVRGFADPGRTVGVLTAEATLDALEIQDILLAFSVSESEYICFLGPDGDITARCGNGLNPLARAFELPPEIRERSRRERVASLEIDHAGRLDLLSLAFLPEMGGWVVTGQPVENAFRGVRLMEEQFVTVFLLTLFLAILVSFVLARLIGTPIKQLIEGLESLAAGRVSTRVPVESDDDLGRAGRALNALAETMQKNLLIGSIWQSLRKPDPPNGKDHDRSA